MNRVFFPQKQNKTFSVDGIQSTPSGDRRKRAALLWSRGENKISALSLKVEREKHGHKTFDIKRPLDGTSSLKTHSDHASVSFSQASPSPTSDIVSFVKDWARSLPTLLSRRVTPVQLWRVSFVGAIVFGMFSMALLYQYLGQSVVAEEGRLVVERPPTSQVLEVEMEDDGDFEKTVAQIQAEKEERLEEEIMGMVEGYPIESMVSDIAQKDRLVAAFLVGIAKKESAWGKRVPVFNGQDCFNYWGYRGTRRFMGTGGHTCFNNRKDAVETVARRIEFLIEQEKLNTPAKMIIWKCGYSCDGHSRESVRKWIWDVDMYFQELRTEEG